jgi:hypothetical protein
MIQLNPKEVCKYWHCCTKAIIAGDLCHGAKVDRLTKFECNLHPDCVLWKEYDEIEGVEK